MTTRLCRKTTVHLEVTSKTVFGPTEGRTCTSYRSREEWGARLPHGARGGAGRGRDWRRAPLVTVFPKRGAVLRRSGGGVRGQEGEEASTDESEEERVPLRHNRGWRRPAALQPLTGRLPQLPSVSAAFAPADSILTRRSAPAEGAEGGWFELVERTPRAAAAMAGNAKVAPMEETRQSHCNAPEKNAAVPGGTLSNSVTTAKYSPVTFLPKNLSEQFGRLANVYFLLISCLQLFTPLSPTSKFSTAAPFALVLILNMVREAVEDSARHKADQEVNDRLVEVVRPTGSTESVPWRTLVLGDLVWVKSNNEFPADLVLIASSGDQGMCYIDTCNLDGETNLKIRNSIPQTRDLDKPEKVATLSGVFEFEPPNNRLYTFSGKLMRSGQEDVPVDNDNVLLRGAMLRNTEWIFGQVVYVGAESKIMMNSQKGRSKSSNVEHVVNYLVVSFLFFLLLVVTVATIAMATTWNSEEIKESWYIPYARGLTPLQTFEGWITILLLLNNYVPISLYVSMEFAKMVQGSQINWDMGMYHEQTDTPALTRTTNLNEELGQIQYILSDKTGTLTQNVMEFRKCFIKGVSYGFGTTEIGMAAKARGADLGGVSDAATKEAEKNADAHKAQHHHDPKLAFDDCRLLQHYRDGGDAAPAIRDFMRILSVSHTVVPEGDLTDPAKIKYQAESPDEGALSDFAKALGWFFCGRTSTHTTVKVLGKDETYEILNVNKFNSARKRMSVVCRTPEGKIELYVKGADNIMVERLAKNQSELDAMAATLINYGTEGLRTLVLAKRELTQEQWEAWNKVHHDATVALSDREGALERAAEEIEKDMILVGATAIEDKLQEGVPDTIATLARAGIKIWVLTGDKQETAENIAFACRLLTTQMQLNRIVGSTVDEVRGEIDAALSRNKEHIGKETEHLALIVEGKSLITIMDDPALTEKLLTFGQMCKAVVACRVSPNQKRQIVSMVRTGVKPAPMTLAIGDGYSTYTHTHARAHTQTRIHTRARAHTDTHVYVCMYVYMRIYI